MAAQLPQSVGVPPQSVEKITQTAQDYEYNPQISLKNWLRTASTLIREVGGCLLGFLLLERWNWEVTNGLTVNRRVSTKAKETTNKHTCCCFDTLNWCW